MEQPSSTVVFGARSEEPLWVSIPLAEFEDYAARIAALQKKVRELEREVHRLHEIRLRG